MGSILWIHRTLGIGLGLLMLMWCMSGVVMLYVPYPALDPAARIAGLDPLNLRGCCVVPRGVPAPPVSVEMIHGVPTLLARDVGFDLRTGKSLGIGAADAFAIAESFARGNALAIGHPAIERIAFDQWTVSGEFAQDRPLYRIALNDTAGTEVYVSGTSGRIVQRTTASERFWNYLGAVPHWLYFTQLRASPVLWAQVMIWASLAGTLLTLAGLTLGIRALVRARRRSRWSPYEGASLWHHVPGLLAGLFLLSWVFSGWLSLNPWGLLESNEEPPILGGPPPTDAVPTVISGVEQQSGIASIDIAAFNGHLFAIATDRKGNRTRFDATGHAAPLTSGDRGFISRTLLHGEAGETTLLSRGDIYYFPHDGEAAPLPVLRLVARNGDRFYVDPMSGELVAKFGSADRGYRWLFQGLHRLDFAATLRTRPLWDVVMLTLLLGAATSAATGLWLGLRRIRHWLR